MRLTKREEGIQNALDSAEEAKKEMQSLNADNERILKKQELKEMLVERCT